ncbi:gluconolaconase [Acuticoccus sediminis]|uniref:Gluconolaconase n=1 Tax=Acuticoccus sediminis TaxID=2184697 RepID=A0A8B2NR43_9HYPH|nr:SMP-30/gluconolactonase/LRE family protein [Acuticoccus sediminis]RAH97469.1 gluconolaconase [Acuticoccus sediminis]
MEILATGLRFPEGPVVMADGSVLVVEIGAGRVTRIAGDGTRSTVAETGGGPNGAAIGPDGALYVCNNGGFRWTEDAAGLRPAGQADDYVTGSIQRVDLATGAVTTLYTASDQAPLKGPNDIVFDSDGGFWITDHGKVRHREMDLGALCYGRVDGSGLKEVVFPIHSPNGIGLSPDETTLWTVETFTARLWAFSIVGPGEVAVEVRPGARHGGHLAASPTGLRGFDSLAVEADGSVAVAQIYTGAIVVFAPDGSVVEEVPMPDAYATNIAFGGEDMTTAYITLSSTGQLVRMPWSRPGLRLPFNA